MGFKFEPHNFDTGTFRHKVLRIHRLIHNDISACGYNLIKKGPDFPDMERRTCAICSSELVSFYRRENYPMCVYHTDEPLETDLFHDQIIGECVSCGSIQQMHLFDRKILYKYAHNQTFNTPTWKQHHSEFLEFISKHSFATNILDVGGNPDIYAEQMAEKDYKILNICPPKNKKYEHLYEIGNCETYTFTAGSDVIMSHLFEHLYEPRKFVENLRRCNVGKVYISIPNMDVLLKTNAPFVLNSEHTYFVNSPLLQYLFASCGFRCRDFKEYKNHSYFYCFEIADGTESATISKVSVREAFLSGIKDIDMRIMAHAGKKYDFIVPAGQLAQYVNYYLKSDVIGYIDNDPSKQKRLYGSTKRGFPFSELTTYNRPVNILLYGSVYSKELYDQITSTAPYANIDVI